MSSGRGRPRALATLALATAAWLPFSQGVGRVMALRGAGGGVGRLLVQYGKDAALIAMILIVALLFASFSLSPRRAFLPLVVAGAGLTVYLLLWFVASMGSISTLYAIRVYSEPVLGGIALGVLLQRGGRREALPGLLAIVSVVVVLLGTLQIMFPAAPLTAAIRESMLDETGQLAGIFVTSGDALRAFSTLDSPNSLGFFAVMAALMTYAPSPLLDRHPNLRRLTRGLAVIAIAISYSRSALLAAFTGGATLALTYVLWDPRANGALVLRRVTIGFAFLVAALAVLWIKRDDISAVKNIIDGVTGADASARQHSQSLREGLHLVIEEPAGMGLGTVGSRAGLYGNQQKVFSVESAYLMIALEMGWPGLAIAVLVLLAAISGTLMAGGDRSAPWPDRQWARVAAAVLIAQATVFIFLPTTELLETGVLTWTNLGLVLCGPTRA